MRRLLVACLIVLSAGGSFAQELSRAEQVRLQKEVSGYVQREAAENDGVFVLHDDKLDKDLALKLVRVRQESVAQLSDKLYSIGSEFRRARGKGSVQVDFLVNRSESGWVVRQAVIRGVDGQARGPQAAAAPALQKQATAQAKYVCPMGHYSSDKPGKCPKCGMELQRQ